MTIPHPVVLRFAELFPDRLGGYLQHQDRKGRGSQHVDPARSPLNQVLLGSPDWHAELTAEIEAMRQENLAEELEALRAAKRIREWTERAARGPADPWRPSQGGPLREVILTANHVWFETPPPGKVFDRAEQHRREQLFVRHAVEWLETRFGDAVVTARVDHDETACHVHAILVPRREIRSKKRGLQKVLQPSAMPLLKHYEAAQDDVGAHFARLGLGLVRGQRTAAARREALAEGQSAPDPRRHVPPAEWRADEALRLQEEAARLAEAERQRALAEAEAAKRAAALAEREATVAAREAEAEARARAAASRDAGLTRREAELQVARRATAAREAEADAALAVIEAVASGVADPETVDRPGLKERLGAAGKALLDRMRRAPERAQAVRTLIGGTFRRMRARAEADARIRLGAEFKAAALLAARAQALWNLLQEKLPRALSSADATRAKQEFDAASRAADSTRKGPRGGERDDR